MKKIILLTMIILFSLGCATSRQTSRQTGRRKNIEERSYEELPTEFKGWLEKEGLDDLWYEGD